MEKKILEVKDLRTSFYTHVGEVKAIRGVSFDLKEKGTLGIVGESGSGKSVTSLSVMRLLQHPGKIIGGDILFDGKSILEIPEKDMRDIRGNEISMIFQDPMTSLNPLMKIGAQIMESMILHQKLSKSEAKEKAVELLRLVGIPSPEERFDQYPHEFSGGMRQRAMIAIALACEPAVLIADEPTTALDVTIQAQILDLMKDLNKKLDMSIILITHDLGVVADVCDEVIVMYGGLIMEKGNVFDIFYEPAHPYTVGLLNSIAEGDSDERLEPIEGTPPDLLAPPKGCPFFDRCDHAMEICKEHQPPYFELGENHTSACWLLHEDAPKVDFRKGVARRVEDND